MVVPVRGLIGAGRLPVTIFFWKSPLKIMFKGALSSFILGHFAFKIVFRRKGEAKEIQMS